MLYAPDVLSSPLFANLSCVLLTMRPTQLRNDFFFAPPSHYALSSS
jgi:hypothetical protein